MFPYECPNTPLSKIVASIKFNTEHTWTIALKSTSYTIPLKSNPSAPSNFTATPFSVTIAVMSSAGVTSKLGLYTPSRFLGVIITTACSRGSEGG